MSNAATADSRQKLLTAAIALFGQKGRDGVSTREIAKAAGVNIAGIAYHFGGKHQLHTACAEHIAETIRSGVGRNLAALDTALPPAELLERTLAAIAQFMLATPGNAVFARFVLREQMDPSDAFEILYAKVMEPMHKRLCLLWAGASGQDPESEKAKLKVFGLLSQVLFFRMAEAGALRRMNWSGIGPEEIAQIIANMRASLTAALACERRSS